MYDTVVVFYPGGYSEVWQFLGLDRTGHGIWKRVPDTLLKNGKQVVPPSGGPATPLPGFGSGGGENFWDLPGHIFVESDINNCSGGVSSVTVESPDGSGSITGFGVYSYGC
jgi:hypothetical protein